MQKLPPHWQASLTFQRIEAEIHSCRRAKPSFHTHFAVVLQFALDGYKPVSAAGQKCRTGAQMPLQPYFEIMRGVENKSLMLALCLGVNFALRRENE